MNNITGGPCDTLHTRLLHIFYNCKDRPQHVYHHSLLSRNHINGNVFFIYPRNALNGDVLRDFLIKKFSSVLVCRDLPYGGTCSKRSKCSAEVYLPSFVARQFGMHQAIPLPPVFSFNGFTSARPTFKDEIEFQQHIHFHEKFKNSFGFEVFTASANSTSHFDSWWEKQMCIHFNDSASDVVSEIFSSTRISTKYVKPTYDLMSTMSIIPSVRAMACSAHPNASSSGILLLLFEHFPIVIMHFLTLSFV